MGKRLENQKRAEDAHKHRKEPKNIELAAETGICSLAGAVFD